MVATLSGWCVLEITWLQAVCWWPNTQQLNQSASFEKLMEASDLFKCLCLVTWLPLLLQSSSLWPLEVTPEHKCDCRLFLSHFQVLPPHLLSRRPKTAAEWFYSVTLQAGIQNLRCSGWTVRETSSLLDLQRQSEVLMTSILSAAEWLWRRDTATASPVESNRTTPTRPERQRYMFQVNITFMMWSLFKGVITRKLQFLLLKYAYWYWTSVETCLKSWSLKVAHFFRFGSFSVSE